MRHTSYAKPIRTARPDIGLPEPRVVPWVLALAKAVSGAYLRVALGFERVELLGGAGLAEAFKEALSGERRLILAFRHPYGDEPQLLAWVFTVGLERDVRRRGGRRFWAVRPHAVFVHGYEVPRWGGALIRWILPRVGAMPVHHSKMDSAGMARILAAMESGPYPVALAPEGQVSYTSRSVPRLEPGTVRMGFQVAERLARAGRPEPVSILPVSVHYRYGRRAPESLERLARRIEAFVGVERAAVGLTDRLSVAFEAALTAAERHYGLSPAGGIDAGEPGTRAAPGPADESGTARPAPGERVSAVVEAALAAAERILGLHRGPGDAIERLYRIRQEGWDRVFLTPARDPRSEPPLARAALDRRAGEAWYAMRHMELADLAWYFRGDPPAEGSPFHEIVEFAQNLWDFCNRLAGGAISGRIDVRPKRATVIAAPLIELSPRLGAYRADRKAAVGDTLAELARSYGECSALARNLPDERGARGGVSGAIGVD